MFIFMILSNVRTEQLKLINQSIEFVAMLHASDEMQSSFDLVFHIKSL